MSAAITLNYTDGRVVAVGVSGPAGPGNSLSIGTVTTGAAGSSASASITGTAPNQTLNLTLPTGPQGTKGDTGTAATVTVGSTTTGAAGSSASVTNSGSSSAAVLNFTVPKGDTGTAATVSVGTTTTGAAGTSASVTNAGTSSAAVLNFTVPQGSTGPANTLTIGTVSTVAAGGSATATITGTAPNQTLNLGIPTGATGAAGDWSAAQPNRTWSSSTTLVNGDAGKLILVDSSTAISVGTGLNLAVGQRIDFLITSSTVPTISASGTTLNGTPTTKFRTQYSAATLICTAVGASGANTYVLVGDLAAV